MQQRIHSTLLASEIEIIDIPLTSRPALPSVQRDGVSDSLAAQGRLVDFDGLLRGRVAPVDHDRFRAELTSVIRGEKPQLDIEYRAGGDTDGTVRWLLGRGSVIHDEGGVPLRLVGTIQDITRFKRAEEEARRAERAARRAEEDARCAVEQLRLATRLSGVQAWSFELSNGDLASAKATFVNVLEPLGYGLDEVPAEFGSSLAFVIFPDDQARVFSEVQACLEGKAEHFESEYRVRYKDGSLHWNLARGVAIRDAGGRPIRFAGTSVDVTRLKQVEEDARTANERLEVAAQLSGFAVVEFDLRGATDARDAIAKAESLERCRSWPPAMSSRDLREAVSPEDRTPLGLAFYDSLSGKSPEFHREYRARSADDDGFRWRLARGKSFFDESGAPVRYIGVSHDIQRVKTAEEDARRAEERLRLATELSGVAVWGYELDGGDLSTAKSTFAHDGLMESLGYDSAEVPANLSARMALVVPPEEHPRLFHLVQDCIAGKLPLFDAECRYVSRYGSVQWKLVRGIVTRDGAGRPLTFTGTAVDITQLKQVQEELQRVKDRLELAVLGSKACTWDLELTDGDLAGSVPVFTNAWELCGYDVPESGEAVGQTLSLLLPPEEVGPFIGQMQGFLDGTAREWERELEILHKDGTERWHLTRGVAARDAKGRATRFTGASIDITDRKLTERALQESEERFRRTFENAAVGMIITDTEGRFLEHNARFCEFLGYAREELTGRNFVEFMVPDEVAGDMEWRRRVVRGEIPSFTRDKRYFRKDGTIVWGSITVSVIQRQRDGTAAHVMAILQDITERKALEVAIEKAHARVELAMRGSDIAVYEADFPSDNLQNTRWTFFNMWEPLGFDTASMPTHFTDLVGLSVHADDRPAIIAQFESAVRSRSPHWYAEHRVLHRDGSVRWRLSRGTLVFDEAGTIRSFTGTEVDVTRLKQIENELSLAREAAEAANRAKDEFLANVSHEIRTPMNAILGMTELALDSAASDHQRQLLSTVRSAAKNLLTIINDLLDFSKIEAGKLALDRAPFSLRAVVNDTLRALAVRAHRKGLELICRMRPEVPDALDGDAGRLRQVLMNLVGNAIKFTPRGEVEVNVEVNAELEPGREASAVSLAFSVRDTGIGIAPEKQSVIFRAFEQEDSSTTRNYGGTGLGLTISAQLVALMDGAITVESAPGRGSTFRFTARFARSSQGEVATASPKLIDLRVLIVDDNQTNRQLLEEWLSSWRMQPTAVSGAGEALAALERAQPGAAPFALVLLDARIPDTDGVTLAGQIRERWGHAAPRLILLSSDDSAALSARSRESGVLAYLLKPLQQSELLEAIAAALNHDLPPPSEPAPVGRSAARPRGLRVLVAEDNELNIALLDALASQRGHHAAFARDGRAALDLAVQGDCDLMLLDLHMPELDGFAVVRAIREHERKTSRHLPIIALTARSSAHDRERCLAAGMDDFLSKPIEAAVLWEAVDRLVARWPPAGLTPAHREPGLLDARAIRRAFDGQTSVFEKLRGVFRQSLPDHMSKIRSALAGADFVRLREAAHQLVGTVATFSTVTAEVASMLEDAADRQERERCVALVEQVASLCDALLVATETLSLESL